MSSSNLFVQWPPLLAGLLTKTPSQRARGRSVKNGSQCKSYTADRAKISHPAPRSECAERLFNDGGEVVSVLLNRLLLLAFDHDAREGLRAGIA